MSSAASSVSTPSAQVVSFVDDVFAAAGGEGDAALRRELANRFASLVVLGPLSVYALEHDAKDFCRWLVDVELGEALDRLDEAIHVVAEQVTGADGGTVDEHRAALAGLLEQAFTVQRPHWIAGVQADYAG